MASITLTIDDTKLARLLDAFDWNYSGRPNGISKSNWARQQLVVVLNNLDLAYRQHLADVAVDPADLPVS